MYLGNKDVFMSSIFYSLEAEMGGALYLNVEASIKNCRFANNTAENHEGNDVYVILDTPFYADSSNVQNTCSLSTGPGQLKMSNGVCYTYDSLCCFKLFFLLGYT
jgi:hypothetical protein